MAKIKDFNCTYNNTSGISDKVTKGLGLCFPQAYYEKDSIVSLALHIKEVEGANFCELPFCHTVEGEGLGAKINPGDDKLGPRAGEYICSKIEEVLELSPMNLKTGRIFENLEACKMLKAKGETVVFMVSGPFTILNLLIDPKFIAKGLRKNKEKMQEVFEFLRQEILRFTEAIVEAGADFISYADSAGALNIIGPQNMEEVTRSFTYPYLKEALKKVEGKAQISLCPKTSFALLGTELAKWEKIELENLPLPYLEACILAKDKAPIVGLMCVKNINYQVKETFKGLKLL